MSFRTSTLYVGTSNSTQPFIEGDSGTFTGGESGLALVFTDFTLPPLLNFMWFADDGAVKGYIYGGAYQALGMTCTGVTASGVVITFTDTVLAGDTFTWNAIGK